METYTEIHTFVGEGDTPQEAIAEATMAANDTLNSEPSRTIRLAVNTQLIQIGGGPWMYALTIVRSYEV